MNPGLARRDQRWCDPGHAGFTALYIRVRITKHKGANPCFLGAID
jgi:hypothetical protein